MPEREFFAAADAARVAEDAAERARADYLRTLSPRGVVAAFYAAADEDARLAVMAECERRDGECPGWDGAL